MTTSFIPESAPFNEEQRAWLNGFFAGMMGIRPGDETSGVLAAVGMSPESMSRDSVGIRGNGISAADSEEEDFPWHDASLPIVDRMELADGRPLERRLMAAMAQLDCGSCGYLCQTYSEAIAAGDETNLTLCSPGGKETSKMIKKVLKEDDNLPAKGTNQSAPSSNGRQTDGYSRQNPFAASLVESRPLNREGSAKDTRHVIFDLADSGITYDVGDAIGLYPTNCEELANAIARAVGVDGKLMVDSPDGQIKSLHQSLCEDYCLKDPSDELLELIFSRTADVRCKQTLERMLDEGVPDGFDVLDVLETAGRISMSATEFTETLAPLNPRLYSIASSQRKVGNQVHLTVGKVVYEREGRLRKGVASTMLADRLNPGCTVRLFAQPNHGGFTVPSNPKTRMIMVGPGTGIAPFMAFLQEREATGAPGKNWLFFGDQHEATDFLYEAELKTYMNSGVLNRLDTAFSRDGERKVYVQDRMREQGRELWDWLTRGAHFYVCGDASRMAIDVDRALISIAAEHGELSDADAAAYIAQLSKDQRYVRDVY